MSSFVFRMVTLRRVGQALFRALFSLFHALFRAPVPEIVPGPPLHSAQIILAFRKKDFQGFFRRNVFERYEGEGGSSYLRLPFGLYQGSTRPTKKYLPHQRLPEIVPEIVPSVLNVFLIQAYRWSGNFEFRMRAHSLQALFQKPV